MNFMKRAFLSITRRKGKALILFAVVFILGNLIAGAISINQATDNVERSIKQQLGSLASIDIDQKAMEKAYKEGEMVAVKSLSSDLIKQMGNSPYVKYYDYESSVGVGSKSIKPFKVETENNMMSDMPGLEFTLKGLNYAPIMDIKEKKAQLVEGRVFTEAEIEKGEAVTLISKKVAEANNLSVGDSIPLQNNVFDFSKGFGPETEPLMSRDLIVKVIGIFEPTEIKEKEKDKEKQGQGEQDFFNTQAQNTLYVPIELATKENQYQMEEQQKITPEMNSDDLEPFYLPKFALKSPEDAEKFKEEITPLVPENYKVTTASDEYNAIAAPIKSMSKMSGFVLIAAVGASLLIVSLVVLLFLRDRKHEFGIYLSLGEKRQRVLAQVIVEVLVVAFVAIGLSVFTGNLLAGGLSNSMIQNQIEAEAEREASGDNGGGLMMMSNAGATSSTITQEDVTKAYQVKLSANYVVSFFLIGLGTILVATVAPMIYLIRLNPKKIMM